MSGWFVVGEELDGVVLTIVETAELVDACWTIVVLDALIEERVCEASWGTC